MFRRLTLAALVFLSLGMKPADPYGTEVLYWCVPEGDGEWKATLGDDCDNPVIPAYPMEVQVAVLSFDGYGPDSDLLLEATADAMGAWNSWLGFTFFVPADSIWEADMYVVGMASGDRTPLGRASFWTESGKQIAYAQIYDEPDYYHQMPEIVAHEFGHLLGLRHDWNKWSVMYPYMDGVSNLAGLEPVDAEILRSWYAPK